jgi:alcohol dehydrogenase class IV
MLIEAIRNIGHTTQVIVGENCQYKFDLPRGSVLLVLSPSMDPLFVKNFISHYKALGVSFVHAHKVSGEPWSKDVDDAFKKITGEISGVVGVGGGSVLDFAKALAILNANGGAIGDYEFGDRKINEATPLWLIPTTCGSGSEVTQYCVINNSATGRKFTLGHDSLKPVQAAVNYELLKDIPSHVRLETGLDAFTHCLEALLNCSRDTLVDSISEEGLRIAHNVLPKALDEYPSNELLEKLAALSLYGGTSISYNRTGFIHTLSVAFSKYTNMSHGLLNASLLRYALNCSLPHYNGHLKRIVASMFGENIDCDKDALQKLLSWLDSIIGNYEFSFDCDLSEEKKHIVNRLMQDKGLPVVTYGGISDSLISDVVDRIIDETR